MMGLEIIHLRLVGDSPKGLDKLIGDIRRFIAAEANLSNSSDLVSIKIWHQSTLATDVAVHLSLRVDNERPSDLGLHIADALGEHGMVEHTLWHEKK